MASAGFPKRGTHVKRKADGLIGKVSSIDPGKDLLTVRWSARPGHNTLVCTSEQFAHDWEVEKDLYGLKEFGKILVIVFVIFIFLDYVKGCGDRSEYTYPRNVLGHKTSVIGGNTELDVTVKLRGWDAGSGDMYAALLDMESVMKHEIKENSGEQSIVFHIVGDTGGGRDDYGHVRPSNLINVFDIQYSMDDLRQIDWEHLPGEN